MSKGWQTQSLWEMCDIRNGSTPSKSVPAYWENGTTPWFTVDDIRDQGRVITTTRKSISQSAVDETSVKLLPPGSVLLCCTASVGEWAITRIPLTTNQQFNGLVIKDLTRLDPNFLFYYASTLKTNLLDLSGKTTIDFVPISRLREINIPIPPLPEQQRIVAKLDEAFAGIAAAKAAADTNRRNARALFDSHLENVFAQRGAGWQDKCIGEIAENISTGPFGTMLHKSDYVADGIPLVNPMNIINSGIVPSSKMMVSETTAARLRAYALKTGDIVIGRRGELGRCAIVTENENDWLCGTGSFFVRLLGIVDGKFFVALFGSASFRARLESLSVGTTMNNLNHTILNNLVIPLPPLGEQQRIVSELDSLREHTQRLENLYRKKGKALDELKAALLHQAFAGEL